MRTVNTVSHLLKTKNGDIGGMLLKSGVIVQTPPGHSDTLRALLKKGDQVRVEGKLRPSKSGRIRVHARKITLSPRNRVWSDVRFAERVMLEAVGAVDHFIRNKKGDRNGFHLTDGTNVIAPRRNREQVLAHLHVGNEVYVEGHRVIGTHGVPRMIADRIHLRSGRV